MDTIISINGTLMPAAPMSMTISRNNLYSGETKRSTETGDMLSYLIRADVLTIDLEYELTPAQTRIVEELLRGRNQILNVEYIDNSEIKTAVMYRGDPWTKTPVGSVGDRRYNMTFSLIER